MFISSEDENVHHYIIMLHSVPRMSFFGEKKSISQQIFDIQTWLRARWKHIDETILKIQEFSKTFKMQYWDRFSDFQEFDPHFQEFLLNFAKFHVLSPFLRQPELKI